MNFKFNSLNSLNRLESAAFFPWPSWAFWPLWAESSVWCYPKHSTHPCRRPWKTARTLAKIKSSGTFPAAPAEPRKIRRRKHRLRLPTWSPARGCAIHSAHRSAARRCVPVCSSNPSRTWAGRWPRAIEPNEIFFKNNEQILNRKKLLLWEGRRLLSCVYQSAQ